MRIKGAIFAILAFVGSAGVSANDPSCPIPVEAFSSLSPSLQEYRDIIATGVNRLHANHPPCETVDPLSVTLLDPTGIGSSDPIFTVECRSQKFPDGIPVKFSVGEVARGKTYGGRSSEDIRCGSMKVPSIERREWVTFGDWHVRLVSDDMDPTPMVILKTEFKTNKRVHGSSGNPAAGFVLIGGQLLTFTPPHGFGRDYWPYCDFNLASYSVSGGKAQYIATKKNPGGCDTVSLDGQLISSFMAGDVARLKLNGYEGTVSLMGFSQAWSQALKHSR